MKKFLITIFILIVLGFLGYFIYVNYINVIPKIKTEDEKVSIDEYYMYGNHLNIKGNLNIKDSTFKDIKLILYNGEQIEFSTQYSSDGGKLNFYISEYINEGIYLDNISRGNYCMFLKLVYKDEKSKDKDIYKYYVLDNKTEYNESIYYTLSKYNNKIIINSENEYQTIMLNISENTDKDIYDITIDPGHGGMDSGGVANGYKETDFTLNVSKKIKNNLESKNVKVKLTYEEDELTKNDILDVYNKHGRAVIPNEVKSKYTLSLHFNKNNSSKVNGLEIYTASDINYDFAKLLGENITSYSGLGYSTNKLYKMHSGVYTHNFTENEISSSLADYEKKGYNPYNVTEKSNYLYMIRETGGYLTGAYIDNSNPDDVGVNPYYNSNIVNESYLLELGYLSNKNDVNIIAKKQNEIAKAISDAILKELGL